jgi:Tol biopolymer transport system component
LNAASQVSDIAISPDGRLVVYVAGSNRALYLRPVDSLSGTLLPGTDQAGSPVFSPDGEWIAFSTLGDRASGSVKKVPAGGGPVVPLGNVPASRGITWGLNDTIVVSTFVDFVAIPGDGGAAVTITELDTTTGRSPIRWFPEVLPGGGIVYTARADDGAYRLAVLDRRAGKERILPHVGASARWSPTGHLLYSAQGALWALPFHPTRLEATGTPVLVLSGVGSKATGASNFAVARDAGTLLYAAGAAAQGQSWLTWIDMQGTQQPVEGAPQGTYRDPRFSPDGTRLLVALGSHLFTYDIGRSTLSQLARDSIDNYSPVWTPDSRSIVFTSTRHNVRRLYVRPADGTGSDQLLLMGRVGLVDLRATDITRDGSTLIVARIPPSLTCWIGRVSVADAKDTDSAEVARNSECNDFARLSPDGRWVAYSVGRPGGNIAVAERFPEGGMRQQLSVGEGRFPLWSRDGRTVYYQAGDSMMAVSVAAGSELSVGRPRLLFRADFLLFGAGRHNADVGPNGRFAVVLASPPAGGKNAASPARAGEILPGSVVLIQDWTSELKRIMRAGQSK